jgi:hypothetical protein
LPDDPIDPVPSRRGRPRLTDDPIDPAPSPAPSRRGRPRLPDVLLSDSVVVGDAMSAAHWARVKDFRQALLGSKISGRLYTARQRNIALNAMKDGLTYS